MGPGLGGFGSHVARFGALAFAVECCGETEIGAAAARLAAQSFAVRLVSRGVIADGQRDVPPAFHDRTRIGRRLRVEHRGFASGGFPVQLVRLLLVAAARRDRRFEFLRADADLFLR